MDNLENQFILNIKNAYANESNVFKGKKYRITILSDVLLRLEFSETGCFCDSLTELVMNRNFTNKTNFTVKEDEKYLYIENKYYKLEYIKEKSFEGSRLVPEANFKVYLKNTDKMWYYNHPEVRNFYGTYYSLDNVSDKVTLKKGLYSTDGFSTVDDSKSYIFNEKGELKKRNSTGIDLYLFVYKKDFNKCLSSYFTLTGYPSLIPRYTLGVWWNKNEVYKEGNINYINQQFKKNGIPYSVLLLGENWHTRDYGNRRDIKTGFSFNKQLIRSPYDLINRLHQNNVFVGLNIDTSEGIYPHEDQYDKISKLLNIHDNAIIPLNIYDTKIINILINLLLNPLEALGTDFFWIDEIDKADIHKLFSLTHYIFNEYNKNNKRRPVVFSRNSNIAPHRYSILYSGKTIVDWNTLKLLPYYNSTSSNLGISWWSHDIGGYKGGIEDPELYMRYVQLGTYSPIFRFSSDSGRYYKREPWKWDVKIKSIVKSYTRFRHSLIPYLYTEAYLYHKTGLPLIQPLYYKYPEIYDEPTYKNEYYFGSQLLVSPITDKKDTVMNRAIQKFYLPPGVWYELKTGKKFPGDKRYITFYKDEDYPVFAKSGSIIPLAKLDENDLNNTFSPKDLEIQIFPGRSNNYTLYEDDGITSLYKEGYFIKTNIDYNYRENNYTLIIRPVEGKSGIIPNNRNYKIRFRNTKYATDVKVYIDELSTSFRKYTRDADFIVEIKNVSTTSQITINCKGNDIEINAVRLINEEIDEIISDLQIETSLKIKISKIIFGNLDIKKKRIKIKKLRKFGLEQIYIRMFIKLLEYINGL